MTFVPGRFFGILGIYGSGKSNLLTAIGHEDWQENEATIIANYHLKFPHIYLPFSDIKTLLKGESVPKNLIGATLLLSELSTGADSYDFLSTGSRALAKLISQIRKAEMVCWYDDQRFGKIVKRLRDTTDGFVLMEDEDKNEHRKTVAGKPETDWHPLINPDGRKCDGLFRRVFVDDRFEMVRKPDIWDGKPYRDLYSTHEIIAA